MTSDAKIHLSSWCININLKKKKNHPARLNYVGPNEPIEHDKWTLVSILNVPCKNGDLECVWNLVLEVFQTSMFDQIVGVGGLKR